MVLYEVGEAGLVVPHGAVAPAAAASDRGGVPVREGRRGWAEKLHGEARKVLGYSIWAMGERTGGATASC